MGVLQNDQQGKATAAIESERNGNIAPLRFLQSAAVPTADPIPSSIELLMPLLLSELFMS